MNRLRLMYAVNFLLAVSFIVVAVTGLLKFRSLMNLLGLSDIALPWATVSFVHDWSGLVMLVLVVVHLVFNWEWIVKVTKGFFSGSKV